MRLWRAGTCTEDFTDVTLASEETYRPTEKWRKTMSLRTDGEMDKIYGSDQEDVVMDIELEFIIAIINSNSMSMHCYDKVSHEG